MSTNYKAPGGELFKLPSKLADTGKFATAAAVD